jgi:hypothetical protein
MAGYRWQTLVKVGNKWYLKTSNTFLQVPQSVSTIFIQPLQDSTSGHTMTAATSTTALPESRLQTEPAIVIIELAQEITEVNRISLPRYLAFANQLPETLLAENLLQKQLFDTGIKTLPATLSKFGESTPRFGCLNICNRVRDRYEDKVARTLAQTTRSSRCGRQLCKQHERSNM